MGAVRSARSLNMKPLLLVLARGGIQGRLSLEPSQISVSWPYLHLIPFVIYHSCFQFPLSFD